MADDQALSVDGVSERAVSQNHSILKKTEQSTITAHSNSRCANTRAQNTSVNSTYEKLI